MFALETTSPAELPVSTSSDDLVPLSTPALIYNAVNPPSPNAVTIPDDTHLRANSVSQSFPNAVICPDDTHSRANSVARHTSPSHYISAPEAWNPEQPMCFTSIPPWAS